METSTQLFIGSTVLLAGVVVWMTVAATLFNWLAGGVKDPGGLGFLTALIAVPFALAAAAGVLKLWGL
jgi:hypothetical protein